VLRFWPERHFPVTGKPIAASRVWPHGTTTPHDYQEHFHYSAPRAPLKWRPKEPRRGRPELARHPNRKLGIPPSMTVRGWRAKKRKSPRFLRLTAWSGAHHVSRTMLGKAGVHLLSFLFRRGPRSSASHRTPISARSCRTLRQLLLPRSTPARWFLGRRLRVLPLRSCAGRWNCRRLPHHFAAKNRSVRADA